MVSTFAYNAFGEILEDNETGADSRFKYHSSWITLKDSGGDLLLSPARLYSAPDGRFVQGDPLPLVQRLGKLGIYQNSIFARSLIISPATDQMDLYQSFGGDPVNYVDPLGDREWIGGDDLDVREIGRGALRRERIDFGFSGIQAGPGFEIRRGVNNLKIYVGGGQPSPFPWIRLFSPDGKIGVDAITFPFIRYSYDEEYHYENCYCCIKKINFSLHQVMFLPNIGDAITVVVDGSQLGVYKQIGATADSNIVSNFFAHEMVHFKASEKIAKALFPIVEKNYRGRCWRLMPGRAENCRPFLDRVLSPVPGDILHIMAIAGNQWHIVMQPASGYYILKRRLDTHVNKYEAWLNQQIPGWKKEAANF